MIQTGVVFFGYGNEPTWNLGAGSDSRTFTTPDIHFAQPFPNTPTMVLAINGIDSDHNTNLRVSLEPLDVEKDEFNIKINAWADTRLYGIWVTWIAND